LAYYGFAGYNNSISRRADVDAIIKDIRFEYLKFVAGGNKVKGHEHKITQVTDSNRKEEEEIFLDDTTATSIKGTLFYYDAVGAPARTQSWSDDETNFYTFGQLNLTRQMEIEGVTRYQLQGNFYGSGSMLNTYEFSFFSGRTFYPTRLVRDYGTATMEGVFAEIDGPNTVGGTTYNFRYLYE
jgi:hypothetical protein